MIFNCPIQWRDKSVVEAAEDMVKLQRDEMCVAIDDVVGYGKRFRGLVRRLEEVEGKMRSVGAGVQTGGNLNGTEVDDTSSSLPTTAPAFPFPKPRSSLAFSPQQRSSIDPEHLDELETLHKILVLYMWMHLRNAVVYSDRDATEDLKQRVEVALDWGLQEVGKGKDSRGDSLQKEKERGKKAEKGGVHEVLVRPDSEKGEMRQEGGSWNKGQGFRPTKREKTSDAASWGMGPRHVKLDYERDDEVLDGRRRSEDELMNMVGQLQHEPDFRHPRSYLPPPKRTPHRTSTSATTVTSTSHPTSYKSEKFNNFMTRQPATTPPSHSKQQQHTKRTTIMARPQWDRPPDLTALLKKYVDAPSLKAGNAARK